MNLRHMTMIICSALAAGLFGTPQASADDARRPYLTLAAAEAGAAACLGMAAKNDWRVAIAVRDSGGNLVLFLRMDDVFVKQAEFAMLKAESAATTPLSTREMADRVFAPGSPVRGLENLPGVTTVEGGEPVRTASGFSAGGVGVSGTTPEGDGICARAAAAAISAALE